jgi:hypothetical protein
MMIRVGNAAGRAVWPRASASSQLAVIVRHYTRISLERVAMTLRVLLGIIYLPGM